MDEDGVDDDVVWQDRWIKDEKSNLDGDNDDAGVATITLVQLLRRAYNN